MSLNDESFGKVKAPRMRMMPEAGNSSGERRCNATGKGGFREHPENRYRPTPEAARANRLLGALRQVMTKDGLSHEEIAARLSAEGRPMSKQRVQQIEARALAKLRRVLECNGFDSVASVTEP